MTANKLFAPLCLGMIAFGVCGLHAQQTPKYLDPQVPTEQRIDDLLPRMTVAEKIIEITNNNGSAAIPRLKIPALFKTEAIHGQQTSTGATIFPQAIAMGATFDPALVARVAQVAGIESKAANMLFAWAPVLNLARDPRWGRVEETYGESPYLVSRMGVAWIDGYQSEGLIATPKHYAVHGAPLGGRDSNDVGYSERVLRETFLPPFRAAFEQAHAGAVMPAYSSWQGVPDNASHELLQRILRQEWGFDGIVVSDCGAIANFYHKQAIAQSLAAAAAIGIKNGVNLNCGAAYRDGAAVALQQGLITTQELDDDVRPILRAKFRLGLFDHPTANAIIRDKLPVFDTSADRALAREVEIEGAVLLKNENGLLPLKKDIASIAVIGPNASTAETGDYTTKPTPDQLVSVLQGIRSHVAPSTQVLFARGLATPTSTDTSEFAAAVAAAKDAQVAVVVVGDNSRPHGGKATTGEGFDSATLELPGAQNSLIQAIQATGTPVVLVVVNGKPFTLAWDAEHIPAILVSWFPGEAGGDATADLLFGNRNPSGRLPLTWPRAPGQLPLTYDYLPSGRGYDYADMPATPQWRFGFGLSYTKFRYSNLLIVPQKDNAGSVDITADVQNAGSRDGDDVVQLYITDLIASVLRPIVELEGFERVSLKAGETKTVHFHLTPYQLSLLDVENVRRVEPGVFRIHVGGVVPDVPRTEKKDIDNDLQSKVGFTDPMEGISGEFNEPEAYGARFVSTLAVPGYARRGKSFPVTVTISNQGNLTDVTNAKLYNGSELGTWGFELAPGQSKSHTFQVTMSATGDLVLLAGNQTVVKKIIVQRTRQER